MTAESHAKILKLTRELREATSPEDKERLSVELGGLLCPYHIGQVLRWGGKDNRGSPAVVEAMGIKLGVLGNPYWVMQAAKLDKRMETSHVKLRAHQLTWDHRYAEEPVDTRTINEVQKKVKDRHRQELKEILGDPVHDEGDGNEDSGMGSEGEAGSR